MTAPDNDPPTADTPHVPGPVETRVRADLDAMGQDEKRFRGSLSEIAIVLARSLDQAVNADDVNLTKVAQVALQLRTTLLSMTEVSNDDDLLRKFFARFSTPEGGNPANA